MFAGFIDPHSHLFTSLYQAGMTLDEVQQMAIENVITSAANMHTDPHSMQRYDYICCAEEGKMTA